MMFQTVQSTAIVFRQSFLLLPTWRHQCVLLTRRIPQRHLVFSFIQHNDGFLHILRVRAIRCNTSHLRV